MLGSAIRKITGTVGDLRGRLEMRQLSQERPRIVSTIHQVNERHLTYLGYDALVDLAKVAIRNEERGIEGLIIEAGCALGGSAIVLASAKNPRREQIVYDSFGMIPEPSAMDGQDVHKRYGVIRSGSSRGIGGERYYGYQDDLYEKVSQSFAALGFETEANNVTLVKGLFEDTLAVESPVALAHIDCDWYESVLTCLARIEPFLVSGGTFIIDDYGYWSGCTRAIDEYFRSKDRNTYIFAKRSRLHITKK